MTLGEDKKDAPWWYRVGSMSTTKQETKRSVSLVGQAAAHSSKCGSKS